jgi:predicted O-methyltransferase YrrM
MLSFNGLVEKLESFDRYDLVMRRSHDPKLLRGLYETAQSHKGKDAIEVGTFGGVSASVLACAVYPGKVFTTDIDDSMLAHAKDLWAFLGIKNILPHLKDSVLFLKEFSESDRIGLGLVDAWHSYQKAITEFNYMRRLITKGVIILDDYDYEHFEESKGDGGVPKALVKIGQHFPINKCYTKVLIDQEVIYDASQAC